MRFPVVLLIIFLSATFTFAQTAALPSQFQSWNEVQLILPLTRGKDAKGKTIDKATATLLGTFRIGRRSFDFLDDRAGATVDYRLSHNFSVFALGLYRRDEIVKNQIRYETRFAAGATVTKTLRGFVFRDRNMFEHRFRNNRADLNLYRNRVQVSYPLKLNKKELFAPFVSEEGFYDLRAKTWFRNEFYAGITRRTNRRTTLDIAYVRADFSPTNVNGISLNLKIKLR